MKMMTKGLWVLISALFALNTTSALAKPNDGVPRPVAYTSLNKAPFGEYTLDKTHAYVTFSYSHQGYSRPWLRFRNIDANLTIGKNDVSKSELSVVIDTQSIDSGVDLFDEHLRDAKFFDVAQFPTITFNSTSVDLAESGELSVTGDLTIKGITQSVVLDVTFNKGGKHFQTGNPVLGFSATLQLKRSDWGLGYGVPIVGDDVDVVIEVEFDKK